VPAEGKGKKEKLVLFIILSARLTLSLHSPPTITWEEKGKGKEYKMGIVLLLGSFTFLVFTAKEKGGRKRREGLVFPFLPSAFSFTLPLSYRNYKGGKEKKKEGKENGPGHHYCGFLSDFISD